MPDIGDFKIAIAAPGTPGDFRWSRRSAYKIAACVVGLREDFLATSVINYTVHCVLAELKLYSWLLFLFFYDM